MRGCHLREGKKKFVYEDADCEDGGEKGRKEDVKGRKKRSLLLVEGSGGRRDCNEGRSRQDTKKAIRSKEHEDIAEMHRDNHEGADRTFPNQRFLRAEGSVERRKH